MLVEKQDGARLYGVDPDCRGQFAGKAHGQRMGSRLGGHIAGKARGRGVDVDIGDVDDAGVGVARQLRRQRPVELEGGRHVHPVELIKLGQLRRGLGRLRLERRGVVDHQRQILMGCQHVDQFAHLLFTRQIGLYQLDTQTPQPRQLGSLAAIAAGHLPARSHQLLAQIEAKTTATTGYQCTHKTSLSFHPHP